MRIDIISIFPGIFDSYLNESILKRAQKKKLLTVATHDPRDFTTDKHRTVDDRPYGGGPGMVMKVEPLYRCLKSIRRLKKSRVILLSPRGETFAQKTAQRLKRYDQLIFICGHYEGIDERITRYVNETISIGDYVLTGGELAALAITDAVTRLIPGVVGDFQSTKDESFTKHPTYREYPHYTRPEVFRGQRVPAVLRSGDHAQIAAWREGAANTTTPKKGLRTAKRA